MTTPSTLRRYRVLVVTLTLAGLLAGGRGSRVAAQGGGEVVSVEFLALQPDGRPVADLTSSQLSVKVDGKERKLQSLTLVKLTGAGAPAASDNPAPFATNADGPGGTRQIFLVFNEESLRPGIERPIRDAVEQLLKVLAPEDRVGLVTAPRGTINVDPTTDRDKVREALGRVTGRQNNVDASELPCQARDALTALTGLLGSTGATAKTVVVFSARMVGPARTAGTGANNGCDLTATEFQRFGTAASDSHAQVYVVQPDTSATSNLEGLQNMAGVTGGEYMRLATDAGPLNRIASETSAYYVATFAPEANERNGQLHRLEVKAVREGIAVRARTELSIPKPAARAAANPKDMVKTTAAFRDLGLRLAAFPSRGAGGKTQLLAITEPLEAGVKLSAATLALVDAGGRIVAQSTADDKQLAAPTLMMALIADPGTYRLRAAVVDTTGRSGAVDLSIAATLVPAGPLKLSGIVLSAPGAAGPAFQFTNEPTAVAFLEMYGQLTGQVSARMEVAATADGPALAVVALAGRQTPEPDRFTLSGQVPLDKLAPGDYVVRAIVNLEGQPEGRVVRTLRKLKGQ